MPTTLACPHGHTWLAPDAPATGPPPVCPICSTPATQADRDTHAPAPAPAGTAPTLTRVGDRGPGENLQTRSFGPADGKEGGWTLSAVQVPGYEGVTELGRGGMGVVYLARQVKANRLVALKMVLTGAQASVAELARFRSEAEAAARLTHPGIAQVYEVGEHNGLPFFSMEFCPGGSLAERLAEAPLPFPEAAALVQRLALAVQSAHAHGIVHRDLKPSNVLLAEDRSPKVTDFGIAKRLDSDGAGTRTGSVLGTPSYMAPEQACGSPDRVGPASDVYSLGAILYECLTGRPPFKAPTAAETVRRVIDEEPVPPSRRRAGVPRDLETVCLTCLQKEPGRRYASAADLAEDLRRFLAREPILARPVGRMERAWKWVRRNPAVAALLAAVALSLAGGTTVSYLKYREAREHEAAANTKAEELRAALEERDTVLRTAQQRARDLAAALGERNAAALKAREEEERALHLLDNSRVQLAQAAFDDRQTCLAAEHLALVRPGQRGWEWHYLRRRFEGSLFTLDGHGSPVLSVCYSPDGSRLATASDDGTVQVLNARTGDRLLGFRGHAQKINAVRFSPDGSRLATASDDQSAAVWDACTGARLYELEGHGGRVNAVCFSPDGARLATASKDRTARIWDARLGTPLLDPRRHTGEVNAVCFSPDGARLATASDDRTARVWDARTGARLLELKGHAAEVNRVCFSADGRRVATASDDKTARVWDAQTGAPLLELDGHADRVTGVCFSSDGTRLATASYDRTARVWDGRTGPAAAGRTLQNDRFWHDCFRPDGNEAVPAEAAEEGSDRGSAPPGDAAGAADAMDGDPAERFHRLWFTRPEPGWHEAELTRLTALLAARPRLTAEAGTPGETRSEGRNGLRLAARFHYDRLLAHRPDRRDQLLAQHRQWYAGDPLALARAGVHSPAVVRDTARERPAVVFLAVARDPLALRTLGGLLLRDGKPAEALAPLRCALALRAAGRPPAEELLLAWACAELGRPGEARDWLARADAWVDRYRQPFRVVSALASGPAGPLAAATEVLKPQPDPGRDAADWEAWHELDVFRHEARRRLAATP